MRLSGAIVSSLQGICSLSSARAATLIVSFLSTTIIARRLGAADYGLFVLVSSIYAYLMIFAEYGSRTVVMAEASALQATRPLVKPYLKFRLSLGLMTFLLSAIILLNYDTQMFILGLGIFSTLLISPFLFDWALMVEGRYMVAGWTTTVRALAYLLLIVPAACYSQLSLSFIALAFPLSWAIAALYSGIIFRKSASNSTETSPSPTLYSRFLKSGTSVIGTGLASQVFQTADIIWIGMLLSPESTGAYGLAVTLITAATVFGNALGQYALSKYGRFKSTPHTMWPELKNDIFLTVLLGLIVSLGSGYAGPLVVPVVFGTGYQESARLLVSFIPYLFLFHTYSLLCSVFLSVNWENQTLCALTFGAILLPVLLMLASPYESLHLYAWIKGLILELTMFLLVFTLPAEERMNTLKTLAPTLFIGALLLFLIL